MNDIYFINDDLKKHMGIDSIYISLGLIKRFLRCYLRLKYKLDFNYRMLFYDAAKKLNIDLFNMHGYDIECCLNYIIKSLKKPEKLEKNEHEKYKQIKRIYTAFLDRIIKKIKPNKTLIQDWNNFGFMKIGYVPIWTPIIHKYYPEKFKNKVMTWLLINNRNKIFYKDLVYLMIKTMAKECCG